jgi:branched-chain amino acid transport system ATP-binding protein
LIVTQILELVAQMAWDSGLAVLLVEHNATVALRVARSGVVLNLGTIAGQGTSAELLASEELRHIYLGTG